MGFKFLELESRTKESVGTGTLQMMSYLFDAEPLINFIIIALPNQNKAILL